LGKTLLGKNGTLGGNGQSDEEDAFGKSGAVGDGVFCVGIFCGEVLCDVVFCGWGFCEGGATTPDGVAGAAAFPLEGAVIGSAGLGAGVAGVACVEVDVEPPDCGAADVATSWAVQRQHQTSRWQTAAAIRRNP
jgi:hypothetical protein